MNNEHLLTLNGGSSSIKFAVYESAEPLRQVLSGKIVRIGLPGTVLLVTHPPTGQPETYPVSATDHSSVVYFLLDWLDNQLVFQTIRAVGHRVVHGLEHTEPELVTPKLLADLRRISNYDPDHLPAEIHLIEALQQRHPDLPQLACFDTAFYQTMPPVAKRLPIPRRLSQKGIRRYGFHGLSCAYLLDELGRQAGHEAANGRVILAHLGSGASLTAVREGQSLDTSMGFTPTSGLVMGTRPGDIDPGLAWYLMQVEAQTPDQFNHLINHESGLLGISETSSNMHDLLERQHTDHRAAEAVDLFCYQTKKWVGAFSAVLGGLDTLVFSGGIGEQSPEVRSRICHNLSYVGIELDDGRNKDNAPVISTTDSRVVVRVIPTDEEQMIAKTVYRWVGSNAHYNAPQNLDR